MKNIFIIARKEFKDTIRDKRTLMTMVVIPLLVFPLIMYVVTKVQTSASKNIFEKHITVGIYDEAGVPGLREALKPDTAMSFKVLNNEAEIRSMLKEEKIDIGISTKTFFQRDSLRSDSLKLFYSAKEDELKDRLENYLKPLATALQAKRLQQLHITPEQIEAVRIGEVNTSSILENIAKVVGGFLPYLFIIFCFVGCMYVCIDLFAGEKERGTWETILTAPVHRRDILVGKMLVVAGSGMLSASLAILGISLSLQLFPEIPAELKSVIFQIINLRFVLLLLAMILPLAIFFAGILIPVSLYARTFKEAQSIITPMNFLVVIPALVGTLPGITLNSATAFIPILNITLATKQIIANTISYPLLIQVFGCLILYSAIAVMLSFRQFNNEKNVLR